MLAELFTNLREKAIASRGIEFAEDTAPSQSLYDLRELERRSLFVAYQELLNFSDVADFAAVKEKKCSKGYSCGKSCISPTKNCRNPLEGQAKNYADFLKLQKGVDGDKTVKDNRRTKADTTTQTAKDSNTMNTATIAPVPEIIIGKYGANFYQTDVSALVGGESTSKKAQELGKQIADEEGHLATPVIVIRKGIEEYEVAKNPHNEMLAAAAREAKKIDPKAAEMISTYTVKNQEEADAVLYQREIAGKLGQETPSVKGADFKTVDIKNIVGGTKPKDLEDETLEKIAQSQLKVGNSLPLVVREVKPEEYEVVSGDAAIIAGRRAREIDPRRGETINAFVIPYRSKR